MLLTSSALVKQTMSKKALHFITTLPRTLKQALMLAADIFLLLFTSWCAYSLRLGEWLIPNQLQMFLIVSAPILAIPIFIKFGLYRSVIRYMGEYALWATVKAMTLAVAMWTFFAFLVAATGHSGFPRSVPLFYWLLSVLLIGGSRFFIRWLLWLPMRGQFSGRQVLIYGAGAAGRQLVTSLQQGRDLLPAGFIDDDRRLHGTDIGGVRVYAPSDIPRLLDHFDIHDIIVTLSASSGARRKHIVTSLEKYRVKVRILPALADIANGRHLVSMVREVDIGDLLGRDPVQAEPELLTKCITNKIVLVSGAGGSIGSEICHQIAALAPQKLILLEASEHALYQIERSLSRYQTTIITPCLGSVEDQNLLRDLFDGEEIDTVYHAAAHKHVPLVEANVIEGAHNNVFGTYHLANIALNSGVDTFVLISTDKAVRPTNVMGATKRWAELVVQDCAARAKQAGTGQRFCAVRFGNVLGSSGSVIPLFKEQIAQGGPVTVTHAEVTRYFMSIHEAVELVIQAGSMAEGGEIFLLDMGDPVKIIDLAANMIRLAGHEVRDAEHPDGDIEIAVTGLRPGEKLYEELLIAHSNAQSTSHPKIMCAAEPALSSDALHAILTQLESAEVNRDADAARTLLMAVATPTS